MDMVISRVHCDAKKKDRKSTAHIYSCARERGSEASTDLMKNLPTEKDCMIQWGLTLSKALARSDNRTLPGTSVLSKNCWTVQKVGLRFTEGVKEGLSRVKVAD